MGVSVIPFRINGILQENFVEDSLYSCTIQCPARLLSLLGFLYLYVNTLQQIHTLYV